MLNHCDSVEITCFVYMHVLICWGGIVEYLGEKNILTQETIANLGNMRRQFNRWLKPTLLGPQNMKKDNALVAHIV